MRYRVVLADDEEEVLFGIRNNLDWESYGFEVAGAFSNGRDVLDFLQTQEVDIVITDIRMPFMDGNELPCDRLYIKACQREGNGGGFKKGERDAAAGVGGT